MRKKELKIYTSEECIYCDKLKEGLDGTDLEYINIDVDDPNNDNEVTKIYSLAGEPVIPLIGTASYIGSKEKL